MGDLIGCKEQDLLFQNGFSQRKDREFHQLGHHDGKFGWLVHPVMLLRDVDLTLACRWHNAWRGSQKVAVAKTEVRIRFEGHSRGRFFTLATHLATHGREMDRRGHQQKNPEGTNSKGPSRFLSPQEWRKTVLSYALRY